MERSFAPLSSRVAVLAIRADDVVELHVRALGKGDLGALEVDVIQHRAGELRAGEIGVLEGDLGQGRVDKVCLDELGVLVDDVCGYIYQLLRIGQHKGKNGRVQHLRMNSFGFVQHVQYYAAARLYWEEDSAFIPQLLEVIEIIVSRRLILQGKNISKLFDNTFLMLLLLAFKGTKSYPIVSLSGLTKLLVGGTI